LRVWISGAAGVSLVASVSAFGGPTGVVGCGLNLPRQPAYLPLHPRRAFDGLTGVTGCGLYPPANRFR
jgi:hypothetical protein